MFSLDETYNLKELRNTIVSGNYKFGEYIDFYVYEPKERLIHAPQYEDKIVQLAINNILKEVYNDSFIYDSYACIDNKGTHKCVERISYFLRKAKWEYGEDAYIIKIDIKKFFYSIDRDILKKLLPKKIKCKRTLKLLFEIINSADIIDLLGLPLGNTLSQICANIYMDTIDQYAKRVLYLKYYVRYADDIIIVVENKEEASNVLDKLEFVTNNLLNLQVNIDKTKIFPINQGVNAVGFKMHPTHRLLRDDSKKKIKRKMKRFKPLLESNEITIEKVERILNSWLGHSKHGNSYNFIQSLISKHDYIYMDKNNTLKVDDTELNITSKESATIYA